jgi:hypothetical protein
MSRLVDRILAGCQPCRLSLMLRRDELEVIFRAQAQEDLGPSAEEEKLSARVRDVRAGFRANDPVAKATYDPKQLYGAPVIAADDVAAYALSLPRGTRMDDVVSSMAPPFERFFVEFQKVPNDDMLHAWGALVESRDDPGPIEQFEDDIGKPRWILELTSFLEREKGKPFGPVATHVVGLAEDGTWFRHSDGGVWWGGGPVGMSVEPPDEAVQDWGDFIAQLMFPVLLSISFMHCKNVEVRPVVPPRRLSRKHRKVHGHELVRYHVLDVQPIRRILDGCRKGSRDDLRRALHICRGHFKTFSPDAPLLGRHVGTYWWDPQVRGSKERGTVLKDYRVHALREFGKAYREADENPPNPDKEARPSRDPDSVGRGLSAHNRTQNQIAEVLRQLGIEPLSPARDEPEFDIAWKTAETFYVCEIKSITAVNEERQLRMAIGQVIRYRQKLTACGHEPIVAVVAAERRPSDSSWEDLCENEGILLLWPDVAQTRLNELAAGAKGKGRRLWQSQNTED